MKKKIKQMIKLTLIGLAIISMYDFAFIYAIMH